MKKNHVNRRNFLKTAGMGSLAAMGAGVVPVETLSAIKNIEPMKITKIEAVRFRRDLRIDGSRVNWTWIRLHTNNGIIGIGETYPRIESQIGALKDNARRILGRDPRDIERIWRDLYGGMSFNVTGGAEMRILTAINIAQWDILGKAIGVPV